MEPFSRYSLKRVLEIESIANFKSNYSRIFRARTGDLLRYDIWVLLVVLAYVTAALQFSERAAGMFFIREQTASLAKPQFPLDGSRFRLFAVVLHLRLALFVHLRVLNSEHDHYYYRDDDQSGHHADHHAQHWHKPDVLSRPL